MGIKVIFAFFGFLLIATSVTFILLNIWMPELIALEVFKKAAYTIVVLAGGSFLLSGLFFVTRKMPGRNPQ
jgi:hypothetical protein